MQIKGGSAQLTEGKIKQRAKSAKLGRNTFSKGYFNKHQDLLVFEEGKKYDYTEKDPQGFVCIRNRSPRQNQFGDSPGKENRNMQTQQQKPKYLFHQDQPELHFYRSPALSNNKGIIRKNIGLQRAHVPYVEPLMKFFHDSIDFERVMEINKQELILQDDYSIYQIFNIMSGQPVA